MECIFCKIAKKEIPADIVSDDGETVVFKDIHPKAPVHMLIIPKTHIQSIAHLEADCDVILTKIIYGAKRAAERIGLKGYKLVFNVGKEGGQVIDHLHLHLLGGWERPEDWRGGLQI